MENRSRNLNPSSLSAGYVLVSDIEAATSPVSNNMYATGFHSCSSGSYSVLVPWSGNVSWVLLRPTSEILAVPPRAPQVAVNFAHWNMGYSLFLLLVPQQPRPLHSRWLAPLCGMAFLWRNDCSPGMFLTHFTLASKLFF